MKQSKNLPLKAVRVDFYYKLILIGCHSHFIIKLLLVIYFLNNLVLHMRLTELATKASSKIRLSCFLLFILLISRCISPVDITPSDADPILVVEGFITDDFGPHAFRISRLARFAGVLDGGTITQVDAEVNIIDDLGNAVGLFRQNLIRKEIFNDPPEFCVPNLAFVNVTTDYLTPPTFRGEIGRSYILEIKTGDQVYRSEAQTILPTPDIDSLFLSFKEIPAVNAAQPQSGVDIFALWDDPSGENFYSWRINGIYRINTPAAGGTACCLFDPTDNGAEDCWIQERNLSGNTRALSDRFFDGQTAIEKVGFIKDNGLRFASVAVPGPKQYYVEVEQYSISEEAFNFFDKINTISSIDGEIFDPPPLSVRGNIFNTNNPDEDVIGFFGAFSVKRKDIFIRRSMLSFIQGFTNPCGDCRLRSGAQVEIPEPYK